MLRSRALKRGRWLSIFVAGVVAYLSGDGLAVTLRSAGPSASQNVALRFPDLSASQNVALRFTEAKVDALAGATSATVLGRAQLILSPDPSDPTRHPAEQGTLPAPVPVSAAKKAAPLPATVHASLALPGPPLSAAATELASVAPLVHLLYGAPALPPVGHSRFCLRYPGDCKVQGIDSLRRNVALTPERWDDLKIVNREVNRDIVAEVTPGDGLTEEWLISPSAGDCKDYAVTKRHELLARGWPSRALLLSEVVIPSGEHHLVLIVRTKNVDLVLDNLNGDIQSVANRQYHWVRIQSPQNPKFWARVRMPDSMYTAMLSN